MMPSSRRRRPAVKSKEVKPTVGWGFRQADATLLGVFEYDKGKPSGFCCPIRVVILPLVEYRRLRKIEKAARNEHACERCLAPMATTRVMWTPGKGSFFAFLCRKCGEVVTEGLRK